MPEILISQWPLNRGKDLVKLTFQHNEFHAIRTVNVYGVGQWPFHGAITVAAISQLYIDLYSNGAEAAVLVLVDNTGNQTLVTDDRGGREFLKVLKSVQIIQHEPLAGEQQ